MKLNLVTYMGKCNATAEEFYDAFDLAQGGQGEGVVYIERRAYAQGFRKLVATDTELPQGARVTTASVRATVTGMPVTVTCFKSGKVRFNTPLVSSWGGSLQDFSPKIIEEITHDIFNSVERCLGRQISDRRAINLAAIGCMGFSYPAGALFRTFTSDLCSYVASPEVELSSFAWNVRLRDFPGVFIRVTGSSGTVQALGASNYEELVGACNQIVGVLEAVQDKQAIVPEPPRAPRPRGRPPKKPKLTAADAFAALDDAAAAAFAVM